ncbi:hypothetical protein PTTG_11040, partial [Puccinia triticina 1-1 BBBD Race 1]|uniref:Uncharacterized protein n=2 Tax=Puccinia triticina TaxID=208348 RepID=A0A0C4FCT6_PUCT1
FCAPQGPREWKYGSSQCVDESLIFTLTTPSPQSPCPARRHPSDSMAISTELCHSIPSSPVTLQPLPLPNFLITILSIG